MELGAADAEAFHRTLEESKSNGTIGLLTADKIDRQHNITSAVKLALIPFMPWNKSWFAAAPNADVSSS
jgi:non-canonical (house-cleaning) NTP pyrophosphatase